MHEIHPETVGQVADVIRQAERQGLGVRVAGSGHSFTDAVCTPDVLLVLDRMHGVEEADPSAGRVRVQAGCTLAELSQWLASRGLALRNLGDIDSQTIAGAIATGTHGTGVRSSMLSEQVTELELVDGHGHVHQLHDTEEHRFRAAQVALGALGVVTSVTLRCQEAFRLRRVEQPGAVQEILERLPELAQAHDHFETFIFPHANTALSRWADPTSAPVTPRPAFRRWVQDVLVANHLFEALLATGRAAPSLVPLLNRVAARATRGSERVQDSRAALASRRLMRFVEMEWLLPAEAAADALESVRDLVRRHRLKVNMPIELRFLAADQAFLSPAYNRQSCCLAVHAYRGMPWQPYFRSVERIMWEFGGRPHWGKLHFQTFETLRDRYPAWDRFQDVRASLDPSGRFRNAYTDRVLGLPAGLSARSG